MKTVMANFILEGVYFYSGFSFFFALGRQGKMLGTVSEIEYIQRDEQISGLTNELIAKYIQYLANLRLKVASMAPLFPQVTEHPMPWVEQFAAMNSMKTDLFEQKVTNYSKSANLKWDDL